jgi:hypothetical protein
MDGNTAPELPPPLPKGERSVIKICVGAFLIGIQLMRQPGFGFDFRTPASSEVAGHNIATGAFYVLGVILILAGLRRGKPKIQI